jgi:hypothetical protein
MVLSFDLMMIDSRLEHGGDIILAGASWGVGRCRIIFGLGPELGPLMHAKGYEFQATLCNMRILECRCNYEGSALE